MEKLFWEKFLAVTNYWWRSVHHYLDAYSRTGEENYELGNYGESLSR